MFTRTCSVDDDRDVHRFSSLNPFISRLCDYSQTAILVLRFIDTLLPRNSRNVLLIDGVLITQRQLRAVAVLLIMRHRDEDCDVR